MEVRELARAEQKDAFQLAWRIFQEFEAPEYSEEGVREFRRFLEEAEEKGGLTCYGALLGGRIVGLLATRSEGTHISLFFVDGTFHRLGIGRRLFEMAASQNHNGKITVNSSPYAVEIYHKLGFADTGAEQVVNGIRFTPMAVSPKGNEATPAGGSER